MRRAESSLVNDLSVPALLLALLGSSGCGRSSPDGCDGEADLGKVRCHPSVSTMKSRCVHDDDWDVFLWSPSGSCETGQVCVEHGAAIDCAPDPSSEYRCSEVDATRCRPDASIGDHAVERCQVVAPGEEPAWWLEQSCAAHECAGEGCPCEEGDGGARCVGPGLPGDTCSAMGARRCRPQPLDGHDAVEECRSFVPPGMGAEGELAWSILEICSQCLTESCVCQEGEGGAQCAP